MHCVLSYDTVFRFDDVAIVRSVSRLCMTMLDCLLLLNPYILFLLFDHETVVLFGLLLIERSPSRMEPPNLLLQTPTPFHKSGKTIELVSLSSPLVFAAMSPCWKNPTSAGTVARSRST